MELALYSLLTLAPIVTIFLLLVIARRPAKQAMPVAYLVNVSSTKIKKAKSLYSKHFGIVLSD